MMLVKKFNALEGELAVQAIEGCCASPAWAKALVVKRPFANVAAVQAEAVRVWQSLSEADYLQAFDGHPKIGDPDSLKKKYAATHSLASQEQSGVNSASEQTIEQLAHYNQAYEAKFGFIFIVCATGKTATEMLELIKARLPNARAEEVGNAAAEQQKITAIRLNTLFTDPT